MAQEDLILRCTKCGAKNRVSKTRLGERPICGKCKEPLKVSGEKSSPVDVKDQTFNHEVLSHQGTVLVDCWAPWCGPCRMVAPVLDQLASEYAGRLKIAKLNTDENPVTASICDSEYPHDAPLQERAADGPNSGSSTQRGHREADPTTSVKIHSEY